MFKTAFDLYRRLGRMTRSPAIDGYLYQPFQILDAGVPGVVGKYYPTEEAANAELTAFDEILFRHENGIHYIRGVCVKTGVIDDGIFGELNKYRLTFTLTDGSQEFYRTISSDLVLNGIMVLLYFLMTPYFNEPIGGDQFLPLPTVRVYPWGINMETVDPVINMKLRPDRVPGGAEVVIAAYDPGNNQYSRNTVIELPYEVDTQIDISSEQRNWYVMPAIVEQPPRWGDIRRHVPLQTLIAPRTGLMNVTILNDSSLKYIDLSGNQLSDSHISELVYSVLKHCPSDGYLDISGQIDAAPLGAGVLARITELRAHGWNVITD